MILTVTQNVNQINVTVTQSNTVVQLQPILNTASGGITIESDPIFLASEASNFVDGDKSNLDNQSGINTGDETTSSIQTKRPLKTVNNESLEGIGNIQIDYNDLDNLPTIPTVITNHSGLILDDGTNPHGTTKGDVGLSNVPNLDTTEAVNNEHTHSNKTILDNTTESFITTLKNAYNNAVSWITTNGTNLINHLSNISNPHNVTKSQVGLSNVDNTSDANKPISTATQNALNLKLDKVSTSGVERAYIINADGSQDTKATSEFGTIKGTGTINRISKFTASGTIGDSQIFDNGTSVGIGTTSPSARLDVRAQGALFSDIAFRVRNSTDTKNFLVVNGAGDVYNNGAGGVNTNTFFGENVGRNTTGGFNAAIGTYALFSNTIGNSNAAIGVSALRSNTIGNSNAAIGVSALRSNTTGNSNTAIGVSALFNNTTGNSNTAIGLSALFNNTTGNSNTAIGGEAGYRISDGSNQTITNSSIFIGTDTRALANNQTNQIVIGDSAIGLGSNSVVLGNTSITITQLRGQVIMGAFASAPTGIEGAIYYNSTTKKHYGFDGTNWNALY